MLDLVIRGAEVIDGSGAPRKLQDVGITGDRITRLGKIDPSEAHATIDAGGRVVSPGFIDVHNHSEGWLLKMPQLAAKTSQGFTTEILMSDGMSYAPVTTENYRDWFLYLRALNGLQLEDYCGWQSIAEYLSLLDGRTTHNVAAQIPYANLRVMAAGWGRGPLNDTQIRLMRRQVELAMDAGAVGVSTGLDYIAQCFATTDEIVDVCSAMAPFGGVYATHVRYKKGTLRGVQEAVEIGRRAGVKIHISHLKGFNPQEAEQILDYIDRVACQEVDFSFDIYPYLQGSTMLNYILPYEVWEDGPLAVCARLRDPEVRSRFEELLYAFGTPTSGIHLAWMATKANTRYQGQTLADYIDQSGKSPGDAVCDLLIEENLAGLSVLHNGQDPWVEPMLAHEKFMLGSDGIWFADGQVHPRVYGSATRLLGHMTRERKLFSLETAVHHMSQVAAERFGLKDRGVVREGAFADLVVFDPATVADRATYSDPHQLSAGIDHVLVNGVQVWNCGAPCDTASSPLPGRVLRYGK